MTPRWQVDMWDLAQAEAASCADEDCDPAEDDGDDTCAECGSPWPAFYSQPCPSCREVGL